MGTDISRVRHDPLKDFGGIALQQGRLLLDADFNEYVAMLDRRLRAETMDLTSFGPDPTEAGVAWVPRLTPNGFRVEASGGSLSIGRGRMYVDGLLAENHGFGPLEFDAVLAELSGTIDTPYEQQPYWDTPDPLPSQGPHLAYLDVWQREVTHLEDPDLVETAIGVDTAGRLQTVWQVRVLRDVGAGACTADDADLDGWLDIIRPSAGRLSTHTIEIDPTTDPCELPPSGGYRGVENQTYRIEVHQGGAPGTATFKWSRDNGSVAVPVAEVVSTTSLRLTTLGRDDVLRISTGDWVEILDDHREFNQQPGVMRKVTVDDATRTISFTGVLPVDLRPADTNETAERHFRVRRWDQSGTIVDSAGNPLENLNLAGSTGLIEIPTSTSTEVVLEHGIVASFSTVGNNGEFRSGDYWIVAARTADTSVEILIDAPPLGIHHHYARLGTVTFPNAETSCRRLWPPLAAGGDDCGDCTVCVTPQSHADGTLTLQAAIDSIAGTGGTVCLAPGGYDLGSNGATINQARNLRIRGQGLATILGSQGTALTITNSFGVIVENLAVVSGLQTNSAVAIRNVVNTTVQDTAILAFGTDELPSAAIEMSGVAVIANIRRNVLVARVGIDGAGAGFEQLGVMTADLSIEDNVIAGIRGIDLGGRSIHLLSCRIDSNKILSAGTSIRATGAVAPTGTLDVTSNDIVAGGTGIKVGGDATVAHNAINSIGEGGLDGIVVAAGGLPTELGDVQILANRIHDRRGRGIALEIPVRTFMVKQNIVRNVGAGIVMSARAAAGHVAVDNNAVSRVGHDRSSEPTTAFGIALTNALFVEVSGNTVFDVGTEMVQGAARVGLLTVGCRDVHVSGNVVYAVGPQSGFVGVAAGIGIVGPFQRANVSENSAAFALAADAPEEDNWWALLIASSLTGLAGLGKRATVEVGNESLVLTDGWAAAVVLAGDHSTVSGNTLTGGGRRPTCQVHSRGDVIANANQCAHAGESVGMLLHGGSIAAASNRVRGGQPMLVIQTKEDRFSAVGNLVAGGTHLGAPGNPLPGPWDVLNPVVS